MTDWKEFDFHKASMEITLSHLQNAINEISELEKKLDWFDGLTLLEQIEPVYGTSFIVLQNYINTSIYEHSRSLKKKIDYYQYGEKVQDSNLYKIELIIAIANYFKHRDDDQPLHAGTLHVFKMSRLKVGDDITESPILQALEGLAEDRQLNTLKSIVIGWRDKIWKEK